MQSTLRFMKQATVPTPQTPERPAKRRRVLQEESPKQPSPRSNGRQPKRVIADSDAESGDEAIALDDHAPRQTDLEQALPPVPNDKEAIEEYETRRVEGDASSLGRRLESGTWVRGRSSIYVDAFNLALRTVLDEESHLFNKSEMAVFAAWEGLSYEGQYLWTSAWHRINKLGYYSDIASMEEAVQALFAHRDLPPTVCETQVNPGELDPPVDSVLKSSFAFADCSDDHITSLEEASTLLLLDELKLIAKDAKVQGKTKAELIKALRRNSGKQTALGFAGLKRSDTEESVRSAGSEGREDSPSNRDEYYTRKILAETGQCIRLSVAPFKLFERVHLVFYRSTEWTEKSLTTIILARIARRNYPDYVVSRSANIFPSRSLLLEFEASLRTQFRIDNILEFNGQPTKESFEEILDMFEHIYPRWKTLLAEEQRKEDSIYSSGEGAYLRRLSPAWVYTRIVHKGAYVLGLGKIKDHKREHEVLSDLVDQRLFHAARRGAWYQRKALLEEHYMGGLNPAHGRTPEQQKRHWHRVALQTCEQGLQDNLVHVIHHFDLQKRVVKLERRLNVAKRLQHDFGHALLAKPDERTFEAVQVERPPARQKAAPIPVTQRRLSIASNQAAPDPSRRGAKTMWLDPADESQTSIVSVEAMCLSHYRSLGWRGYHTEGGVLRTLFALLFYDVLFIYLPNVFQTAYQTCPLDLHTDAFYPSRISEINARLAEISNGGAAEIVTALWERESAKKTCVVGLDWSFELEDIVSICSAFAPDSLAAVLRIMCQEYAQRGGGIPDLFLWRDGTGNTDGGTAAGGGTAQVMFAEVKSANDRLSDTQRQWIHALVGCGIRVELCHARASEVRVVDG